MPEEKTTSPSAPRASAEDPQRRGPDWWPWIRTPVLAFSGVIAVLVSVMALWGINLYLTVGGSIRDAGVSEEVLADPWDFGKNPRNVLVLGSDSRAGLSEEDQAAFGSEETVSGERSDTIILMSIDPRREQAVVVHFPRDLRVEIPGYGFDKINAAYEYGGPDLVVRTVHEFTGMQIHNYMEIDLAGFQELVETLGGVRICVDLGYSLNGKSFPATAPIVADEGDWVLFHYFNEGTQMHPMHLHQFDQIVIAKDGYTLDQPYVVDTLNVAPGERYSVLVELDNPGTWVWHCHILPHVEGEDGMFGMVTAVVVNPNPR